MIYNSGTVWYLENGMLRARDYKEISRVTAAFDEKSLFLKHKYGAAIIKNWVHVELYDD